MNCLQHVLTGWLCLIVLSAQTQSVVFYQLPATGQLYPRTAQSVGLILISGRVTGAAQHLSVVISRNGQPYGYRRLPLVAGQNGQAPFSTTLTIPAELAQFRVQLYLRRATDSLLVADRQRIVAGDAYVINGQSNAAAFYAPPEYTYQSEFIRTYGVGTGTNAYNTADSLWAVGNLTAPTLVGTWGMELAHRLLDRYGVPVCFINGAAGGEAIQIFNARNAANPMDLNTNYGRLLYRVNKAGLTGSIKAYFFRQGENESSGAASGWPGNFDILFANVQTDYPNLGRFYLFQINVLAGTNDQTAVFRDYQRRLGTLQPLIQAHATVGTASYDGIHYGIPGHAQTGLEMFRLVARDFYSSTDTDQITSPSVQKVYYTSPAHTEITVQFEEEQRMTWPADTTLADTYGQPTTHTMKQWLYLDNDPSRVASGRAEGYRVTLTLSQATAAQQLGYLPPNYPKQIGWIPFPPGYAAAFPGPFLKNGRGLCAFAFWNVPIGTELAPLLGLSASGTNNVVQLTWADHPAEQQYVLERRRTAELTFSRLVQLSANTTTYTDSTAQQADLYRYRLRAVTPAAEATADAQITFSCQTNGLSQSVRSGNWHQAQTWLCGYVPPPASTAQVLPNRTVTLTQSARVVRLRLGGQLRLQAGGSVRLGQ